MHIKTLLALLPLLLNPASSLAIPPAGDQGVGPVLDPSAQQNGDIYNRKAPIPPPFHRGQRNRIENHVKPIMSEKIVGDFGIGSRPVPQKHTLNARAPGKNSNNPTGGSGDPNRPKPDKPESSETKGPTTRSKAKAQEEEKKAQEQAAKQQKKPRPQGEPSNNQPGAQPGSSDQKDGKQEEKEQQSNTGGRQMTLPNRPKPKTNNESTDNTKQNQPGQAPDQQGEKKDGADKKDGKGDEKPAGNDDAEKKKKEEEEKKKKEEEEKKYAGSMYHAVTPDPRKYRGLERLDGQREFMRKIGDGNPNANGRYGTHSPSVMGVQSHNQVPGVSEDTAKKTGQTPRKRPGEREERVTTGHKNKNEKGESLTEWHKITPKKQKDLPKGTKAWTNDEFRENLIEQNKEFPGHKSEDKDDKYGKLTQKMIDMCDIEQCTKQEFENNLKRSIAEQPLLRRRMESLLEERDHILTMAMR